MNDLDITLCSARLICNSFVKISSTSNGGSLSFINSNFVIDVLRCIFIGCFTSAQGGAIFTQIISQNFKNNQFNSCFSGVNQYDKYGNVLFSENAKTYFNDSTICKCAPDNTNRADSCICLHNNYFVSLLNNGSYNYGYGGGSLISFDVSYNGTFVKLNQVYKCADDNFIEISSSTFNISFNNFIDGTRLQYLFWVSGGTASFENCIFINTSNKVVYGEGFYNFHHCYANEKTLNIQISSNIDVITITILINPCYLLQEGKITCKHCTLGNNTIQIFFFILFIDIH